MIHFGTCLRGRVDEIPGGVFVATEFWHISELPLVPTRSFIVTFKKGNRWQGVALPALYGRSVVMGYARSVLVLATVLLGVAGVFGIIFAAQGNAEAREAGYLGLGGGFLLLILTILVMRIWRKATPERQAEIQGRLGRSPEGGAGVPADPTPNSWTGFFDNFERSYRFVLTAYGLLTGLIFAGLPLVEPFFRKSQQAQIVCLATAAGFLIVAAISLAGLMRKGILFNSPFGTGDWQTNFQLSRIWPFLAVLVPVAFPAVTVCTLLGYRAIELGEQTPFDVIPGIPSVYHVGGFWPAVLCTPLLGLLLLLALLLRVRRDVPQNGEK